MALPFLPMFPDEMKRLGWPEIDVLFVTGDAYVDHPANGVALLGRLLEREGYRVGIVARPRWDTPDDIARLGRPRLAAFISAGSVDSLVANYTANKRPRREEQGLRPDRACIVYANRVRAAFKGLPVILGGVEASLRRLAHYDYWDDAVRRSLLFDAKADLIVYGMGERQVLEIVRRLAAGEAVGTLRDIPGTLTAVRPDEVPADAVRLPSFDDVRTKAPAFNEAFRLAYGEMDAARGRPLAQPHGDRVALQLPPAFPLSTEELDRSYDLPYTRRWHPSYDAAGGVPGFEVVRWSITAARGCPGECSFCGITMHQGRVVQSRSARSILAEAKRIAADPDFRGTISDVGGATANLYAASCGRWDKNGACRDKQCMMPGKCPSLKLGYARALELYRAIRRIPGVKHVFVSSGLRYDLLTSPEAEDYLRELCQYHVSGQMKVAPEHTEDNVLRLMNKPSWKAYEAFVRQFEEANRGLPSRRYLVNYFITAHPGCGPEEALGCAGKLGQRRMRPEQIQDFTPLPMTLSACLYHTGVHPLTGERVFVPKGDRERARQRALLQPQNAGPKMSLRQGVNGAAGEDRPGRRAGGIRRRRP